MKYLKEMLKELPDSLTITKMYIETVNKFGERLIIEFKNGKEENLPVRFRR